MKDIAIFTIISKNYLAYARTLTESFLKYHPNIRVFVILVDKINGYINPQKEKFEIIEAEKLGIKNSQAFFFKYNILELNTAVKPYAIEYLFINFNFQRIVYFDPDILITNKLNKIFEILNNYSIILIPHITTPIYDEDKPNELDFLQSGSYNLGFIGLSRTKLTFRFIKWWQDRLYDHCLYKVEDGLFVDQKWIDLVPSLFNDYYILYDPGYNVAYWNLHERNIILNGRNIENIKVNKKHLYFFHFSGFAPERISLVSKHQTRFSLKGNLRHLKPLFGTYANLLRENGYKETKKFPYAYGAFDNGVKISDAIRTIYFCLPNNKKEKFENPFNTENDTSYYHWLISPKYEGNKKNLHFSNLTFELYQSVSQLKMAFPDILGKDYQRYIEWSRYQGKKEYQLDEKLLGSIEIDLDKYPSHGLIASIKKYGRELLSKAYYSPLLQKNKFALKRYIGNKRYYNIRNALTRLLWGFSKEEKFTINKNFHSKITGTNSFGINIAGHITAESGTGEAARSLIKSIKHAKIQSEINNFEINVYRKKDKTFKTFTKNNPYKFNLMCINADQSDIFYNFMKRNYFQGKYNIGYWLWEQSVFPNEWLNRFKYFDEIWTASSFSQEAISKKSSIPVLRVPLVVDWSIQTKHDRQYFSLPKNKFIFLFIFDFLSVFERKNPLAVIEAFKKMIPSKDNALLVLKTVNSDYNLRAFHKLKNSIGNLPIKLIDGYFSRMEIDSLISICDCYISLHRSEGFGYTMFEGMYYGKPVIATAYSGNMDIMSINNSFLIKYKIIELDKDYGVYKKGTTWADPDIDHAAALMKFVYKNPDKAKLVGNKATEDIKSQLDVKTVGKTIKDRIQVISDIS